MTLTVRRRLGNTNDINRRTGSRDGNYHMALEHASAQSSVDCLQGRYTAGSAA